MRGKIKRWIRNKIIRLLSSFGIVSIYSSRFRKKGPLVRVLAFHDVADPEWFRGVVRMLASEFHLLTPEKFEARVFHPKKINVLITFDDGYRSWIDNVVPVLEEYGTKGLFFIISGLLDRAADTEAVEIFMRDRLERTPKESLDWDGAALLSSQGHTIGGHTVTHQDLTKLQEEALKEEISKDKERIEFKLGIVLSRFAYPFGKEEYFDESVIHIVRECGYRTAYTAESGFVEFSSSLHYKIPRTCIENNLPTKVVAEWVRGGYDIVQFFR